MNENMKTAFADFISRNIQVGQFRRWTSRHR